MRDGNRVSLKWNAARGCPASINAARVSRSKECSSLISASTSTIPGTIWSLDIGRSCHTESDDGSEATLIDSKACCAAIRCGEDRGSTVQANTRKAAQEIGLRRRPSTLMPAVFLLWSAIFISIGTASWQPSTPSAWQQRVFQGRRTIPGEYFESSLGDESTAPISPRAFAAAAAMTLSRERRSPLQKLQLQRSTPDR